ncbi:TIGR03619 family F420-dependent LLM class oxidoreductase [Saccharopolyspora rhizosphaerae]|uniref:TIGR03619 family F420-dependent LLM class oxidoreductase n=1 Tax=Saccharopolyspora rhizosphaerae TaxID=2492662 RepID=A0A3R8VM73_9PSEU|nr:TIGR03619 family F420-dependent LLM class oxidoreductase [Saccharopolyspora rhizosphaerae]RRO20543.1 TIGR03619 family F420-dependent LLM class oxidoreductase [Saccharopolyspora rhizosphaerae]
MRVDLVLPSESATDDPRALAELAVAAEHHGFGALWLPDHLLPPHGYNTTYGGVHEPLVTLAFLAAHTERLLLGTSVLIAPLREPVLLAKQTATLHALAPGRVLLGVGTGWERSEFDAVGADYAARGRRTDEVLEAVRELHRTGRGPGGGTFAPTPSPPVPLVVGGTSASALRRAARFGDAWQAVGRTPEQFSDDRKHLRSLTSWEVSAGARITWRADQTLADLVAEIDRWSRVEPAHLAVWTGDLEGARTRIAALGEALALG